VFLDALALGCCQGPLDVGHDLLDLEVPCVDG
jgi:hypothetical protein